MKKPNKYDLMFGELTPALAKHLDNTPKKKNVKGKTTVKKQTKKK